MAHRFEDKLDAQLRELGVESTERTKIPAQIIMLKEKLEENKNGTEERDWNVFEVGRKRYLQKQSEPYDALSSSL